MVLRLKDLFPLLETRRFRPSDPASLAGRIQRERAAFSLHTRIPIRELGDYFEAHPDYAPVLAHREEVALSEDVAKKLYRRDLSVSASQADKYHQCRYAYFLRYGLGISPRQPAALGPMQRGNVIHEAMELLLTDCLDCSDEDLHRMVTAFGEDQLKKYYGDEAPPASVRSFFDALMKKVERLLRYFRKELAVSQFRPYAFEQKLNREEGSVAPLSIPLKEGTLSMVGVVDRVDLYEKDGVKYLRIIDYKSGKKQFSFHLVENGIDVQMLMYLCSLQNNLFPGETCAPAGVQYVGANPATVNGRRSNDPDADALAWEGEIPRSGVYLKDPAILYAMDNTEKRLYLKIQKNDSPYFISLSEFNEHFKKITGLLQEMGNCLHAGVVDKNPVKIDSYHSCEKCDLKNYCRPPEPRYPLDEGKNGTAGEEETDA